MSDHFGKRLSAARAEFGPLCVGIDPHSAILRDWELTDDADGLSTFAQICLEAFAGTVGVVKPQSAFFERFGYAGAAVLEHLVGAFREAGTVVILDAKRGDLDSTMAAYADAYLRSGAPMQVDALTVHPYMGTGSLRPAFEVAAEHNTGLFVLGLTSNPEGASVQHARDANGRTIASGVLADVAAHNTTIGAGMGPFGVVIGATVSDDLAALGVDLAAFNGPILVPGFGAQGAGVTELQTLFAGSSAQVVVNSSRGILRAGPSISGLRQAVKEAQSTLSVLH